MDMYTKVDKVKPAIGQAERIDARKDIKHQDPSYDREARKGDDSVSARSLENGDNPVVHIEALQLFLKSLIKPAGSANDKADFSKPHKEKASSAAAKASSAYEHASEIGGGEDFAGDEVEIDDSIDMSNIQLDKADIRQIHGLLDKLKVLREQHVEFLHLDKSDTFLNSIEDAVNKQL